MPEREDESEYLARMLELDDAEQPADLCAHPSEAVVIAADGWHWCTACDAEAWVGPLVIPPGDPT